MKVALIGNIYGNLPALNAVLADAQKHNADQIWNVGNSLGYGTFPKETLQRLMADNILSVLGDLDVQVLKIKHKRNKIQKSKYPDKWLMLNWIYESLSPDEYRFLRSLNRKKILRIEGKRVLLTHQMKEYNPLTAPDDPPVDLAFKPKSDIIIYTGASEPEAIKYQNVWLINTGSLGIPSDSNKEAVYAILNFRPGFFQVRYYHVAYTEIQSGEQLQSLYQSHSKGTTGNILPSSESAATLEAESNSLPKIPQPTDCRAAVENLLANCLTCSYAVDHTYQVTRLALELFDQLQPLHQLADTERRWLEYGALLHDIGWISGRQNHHKTAFNIIINTDSLPLEKREKYIIGGLARYHRKKIPNPYHLHFVTLAPDDRKTVTILAAILRVADGLDRTHQNLVQQIYCEITAETIVINCTVNTPAREERAAALEKGLLLEQTLERKLVIEWSQT